MESQFVTGVVPVLSGQNCTFSSGGDAKHIVMTSPSDGVRVYDVCCCRFLRYCCVFDCDVAQCEMACHPFANGLTFGLFNHCRLQMRLNVRAIGLQVVTISQITCRVLPPSGLVHLSHFLPIVTH